MAKKRTKKNELPPTSSDDRDYSHLILLATKIVSLGLVVAAPLVPEGSAESFQNWPMLLLWVAAAVGVFTRTILHSDRPMTFAYVDVCFYFVCGWAIISGFVSLFFETGHARPTINATWQWFGYAVSFFVLRSICIELEFRKILIFASIAIASGCSLAGLYQRFVSIPAVQTEYKSLSEDAKKNALRQGGISNVEPGSPSRTMWENRLFSTEPTSTFVLANSLAAFLTPWFVLIVGLFLAAIRARNRDLQIALSVGFFLMAFCMLMTKSRTGLIASGLGVGVLLLIQWKFSDSKIPWRIAIGAVAILVIGAAVAIASGMIDIEVWSESLKSALYRLEYWQASGEMIRDHWLFGCGPGNFQQYYSAYQLPQASETVAEPHNFLIEVWANAGSPAAIALAVGCAFWLWGLTTILSSQRKTRIVGSSDEIDASESTKSNTGSEKKSNVAPGSSFGIAMIGIALGIAIGFFQALVNGFDVTLMAISGVACCGLFAWYQLLLKPATDDVMSAARIGLLAFGVGLCASGGIGFPSVAMSGIVLIAITISDLKMFEFRISKWIGGIAIVFCIFVFFLFRLTVVDPIQSARTFERLAEFEIRNGRLDPALANIENAIAADPADGNYLFFKTQLLFRRFESNPSIENIDELIATAEKSVKARPHHSKVALETGKLFLAICKNSIPINQDVLTRSKLKMIELFEVAVSRRPNDAEHIAYLAFAFDCIGDQDNSQRWAEKATQIDIINPHSDRDLDQIPFRFSDAKSDGSVEQELVRIRKQ